MASHPDEDATRRRLSRKTLKKQTGGRRPTLDFPDRFKELRDDADEDVLPPSQGPSMFMNPNQSIFGIIAAARSTVDFNDRFDGQSSDEDDNDDDENDGDVTGKAKGRRKKYEHVAKTTILKKSSSGKEEGSIDKKHRRRISEQLLQSLPHLPRLATHSLSQRSKLTPPRSFDTKLSVDNKMPASPVAEPQSPLLEADTADREERPAPIMSRMLEARAEMSSRPSFDLDGLSRDQQNQKGETGPSALAQKLKEIFEFDQPEDVIEEYPCWLLQSVLLQGYLYITAKHICFYAYLPKKVHEVAKSGYLAKSGKRNPQYNRFWFRLKGDVLAYYRDASNLYFPHGQIDLRYAISASVTDKDQDAVNFSVVTHHRTYHFRADSAPSAKEWVKSLLRVIFRSHNEGDSVKISLPIENILDVEDSQMIEFADTCKLRVIDNDETYSIDEYFFSFFSFGKEAISVLKLLVEESSRRHSGDNEHNAVRGSAVVAPTLHENVKATLSPPSRTHQEPSSRSSSDIIRDAFHTSGRRSLDLEHDRSQRSFSRCRTPSKGHQRGSSASREIRGSPDSCVQSLEDPSLSGLLASSNEDPSGSQILKGSEVFHRPIIRHGDSLSRVSDAIGPSDKPRAHERQPEASQQLPHPMTTGHVNDSITGEGPDRVTTPTLQNLTKIGTYPLQRASVLASYLNHTSRKMGGILATESMGYMEKVSGMWKGGRKHYHGTPGLRIDEAEDDEDDGTDGKHTTAMERFRAHFALPETEMLRATYFGFLLRVLPLYGKVYISDRHFCFRSLLPGTRTKLILPLKDIETTDKEIGFRFGYSGLVVVIRGHEELFFEFNQADVRDDCAVTLLRSLESTRYLGDAELLEDSPGEKDDALAERDALNEARLLEGTEHELKMPQEASGLSDSSPTILFDDPKASFLNFKPSESLKITCLTIGSRGDVQPYIALCKGLLAEGHKPRIATHAEFREWVESHGIEFAPVAGDPGELLRICIENGTFTWAFLREANSNFRGWLDGLLASAYSACQGSDLLIESPSAMAGIHIAEALNIPYFRAFTMPWTRTRAYPHAFVVPEYKLGGAYNYVTYVMFDHVFWKATAHQVNRWRNNVLGLPNTSLEKMQPNKVPFLYNFSPAVVAPPLDYSDWIRVTGYWFLDEGQEWTPPKDLREFISKARKDGKRLVYVGFGSIMVPDPAKMTQEVIDAVLKADVRCILSKGWSDRLDKAQASVPEHALPPEIFQIKSAPHDWLFRQIDAAAHHGGSGTTGASLRAGIPTIIRPFFGDQFFFGSRVEDLGVGICLKKWGANSFAKALWEATNSDRMIVKARILGETIRKENGVSMAIQCIYRDLEYAKSLVASKAGKNAAAGNADETIGDDESEEEESWTFVGGDEIDPELMVKNVLAEMESNNNASRLFGASSSTGSS
ncbi:putative autophagy-related protein 26 [Rosellinia necatrix]|uniref:sterol 3beta-glucosyltransferase n=1 Tax=Rosellinia necatrix TaxID=77044 RepID=A0A1W2TSN4_ROSNE|nr:putative autophagy-related protein 26 [Rosellinia necatrix]